MGVATLVLVVSLLATPILADIGIGYDSRLSPVELAIIKSVVDTVPDSGITLGNPYNWGALQTRSRALQGADVQVVQVQDRSPDFSGRSGSYPDDASIVQAVSSQLGNLEGPPLQGDGAHGWNIKKSVSAELHLNAQVLPDLPGKHPSLRQVSYNYQEPAFNSPPVSIPSGAHAATGGREGFSFHRSIASELNAAMFNDEHPQRPAPYSQQYSHQQVNNYQQSYSQPQTQQFFHRQQTPAFNNYQPFQQHQPQQFFHQQFSSVSGGQTSGMGSSDFSIHKSVPYELPTDPFVPPRPLPALQERQDFGQQQYHQSTFHNINDGLSGAHKPAGGVSEFSIQKSIASEIPSDTFGEYREDNERLDHPIDIRLSGGNTETFSSSSGHQNSGGSFGFSNQQSISNDIPTELFAPPAQAYSQWNENQGTGGASDVSIHKSIASEISTGGAQQDYSQSEGFVESGSVQSGGSGEVSYAQQVNQLSLGSGVKSGDENQHQGTEQEKADFVEVNIVQSVSSKQRTEEGTSSDSHETSSETENTSSAENFEEYNAVQDTAGEHHSSGSGSSEGDDQAVGGGSGESTEVHTPDRVETPPLETDLPCKEGERRIKNICRKVFSLQLKAHLRKK